MPKHSRAVKFTDAKAEKPWLKRTAPSTYFIESREKKKTFLIVCEGYTEQYYFKSFPVVTAEVKTVPLGCSSMTLVECALEIPRMEDYDEVWCVFDRDIKPDEANQKQDFDNAIHKALASKIHCAYSNDAFELWFLLHFMFIEQEKRREFYFEQLSNRWNINYAKTGKSAAFARTIYQRLIEDPLASQQTAIDFARKLHKDQIAKPFHKQNPVTTVYQLVEILNKYLRQ
ncbi:MAG: RloB family protein [Chitinophagaceae bacterium]